MDIEIVFCFSRTKCSLTRHTFGQQGMRSHAVGQVVVSGLHENRPDASIVCGSFSGTHGTGEDVRQNVSGSGAS